MQKFQNINSQMSVSDSSLAYKLGLPQVWDKNGKPITPTFAEVQHHICENRGVYIVIDEDCVPGTGKVFIPKAVRWESGERLWSGRPSTYWRVAFLAALKHVVDAKYPFV